MSAIKSARGRTEGNAVEMSPGYYADPEAECQVFHICAADAFGGLSKYSFLCPNGKFRSLAISYNMYFFT